MKFNILLTFFLCFLIFITPVYAFSFEDIVSWVSNFFGGITGFIIEVNDTTTTTLLSCPYECCLSDQSTYEQKECLYPKNCKGNKCIDVATTTIETTTITTLSPCPYECCSLKDSNYQGKACPYPTTCTEGKCVETTITQIIPCTDSDGGKNYDVKGSAKDTFGEKTDFCQNDRDLTEYYCGSGWGAIEQVIWIFSTSCPYGCNDGACLPMPAPVCGDKICQGESEKTSCPQDCYVKCNQDSDCGQITTRKICDYPIKSPSTNLPNVPYACTVESNYKCENPGTFDSRCISGEGRSCIPCQYGCKDGACISETVPTSTGTTQPTTYMKEQVTCLFSYSSSMQKCYTDEGKYGCSGVGSCIVEVSGNYGTKLTWKSSCGGYDSTIIDENNGYVNFDCRQATTPIATTPISSVNEQVKCIFVNSESTQKCYTESFGCSGTGTCVADVSGEKGKMLTWKSSCGGYAYTVIDGTNDYAEFNCLQTAQPTIQTPISVENIKEQVWCVFLDSKVLSNPHTATEECHSDLGVGCKWDGNVAEEGGKRYAYCVATIASERGRKVTWKSSCGGYSYSVMDGEEEKVTFQCIPETNVTTEQVVGKGFKKASWQCYDGTEQIPAGGATVQCQPYEYWKEMAIKTCANRCKTYEDTGITKCGVNSFSVSEECYIEYGKEGVTFIHPEQVQEVGEKISMPPDSKVGDLLLVLFYKDNCPYCSGMDEELNKVSSQLNINVMKINADEKSSVVMGYGVRGFPSFILLEYTSDGIKEYMISGKTDSSILIEWINKIKSHTAVSTEKPKEEIPLICKDACPSEGKCYPFGYRKEGKYCSDEGAFKEQLKADEKCENNFECSTNVCVDGKCISSGFIQKIISWFKKLFGAD